MVGWRYGDDLRRRVVGVVGGFTYSCIVQCVYVAAAHAHGHDYTHGHGHRTYYQPRGIALSLQDELALTDDRLVLLEFWIGLVDRYCSRGVRLEVCLGWSLNVIYLDGYICLCAIFSSEELAGHTIHISVRRYVLHKGDSTNFRATSEVIDLNCYVYAAPVGL